MGEVASGAIGAATLGLEHSTEASALPAAGVRRADGPRWSTFIRAVDEETAKAVGAEAQGVEGAAQLSLVLRVLAWDTEFMQTMSKLAPVFVAAGAALGVTAAELRLVP